MIGWSQWSIWTSCQIKGDQSKGQSGARTRTRLREKFSRKPSRLSIHEAIVDTIQTKTHNVGMWDQQQVDTEYCELPEAQGWLTVLNNL